eukprot:gnl/Chilomastix_caulleri/881.p1 GENE.gnl/Chilomastix_caulleri/881~~gnl/Chilomastix_caulleri/881.p1  ORF type:complete len:168 (-),score=35.22 gnl/Chilomastix_caulleri/881:90-593(-)
MTPLEIIMAIMVIVFYGIIPGVIGLVVFMCGIAQFIFVIKLFNRYEKMIESSFSATNGAAMVPQVQYYEYPTGNAQNNMGQPPMMIQPPMMGQTPMMGQPIQMTQAQYMQLVQRNQVPIGYPQYGVQQQIPQASIYVTSGVVTPNVPQNSASPNDTETRRDEGGYTQ